MLVLVGVDKALLSSSLKGNGADEVENRLEEQSVECEVVQHCLLVVLVKQVYDMVVERTILSSLLCLLRSMVAWCLNRGE